MDPSKATEVALEVLASEFTERCRRGAAPSIDDYAERHPELAAQIRAMFPTIESLESLKRRKSLDRRGSSGTPQKLGDYRIVREIGRGGMGVVYEAVQQSLNRRVAVKLMAPQSRRDDAQLQRFLSEARIAGRLHHSNIVPVLGVGVHDGLQYYVMQYIDGAGLNHYIAQLKEPTTRGADSPIFGGAAATVAAPQLAPTTRREETAAATAVDETTLHGPERWREVARIGLQVAQALDYAHRHETLHRDIKPANLMLDRQGSVWVTDFGVAKSTITGDMTRTGAILGTPDYMAPEQAAGEADARSDVYSLGVTLYEMLALRLPHTEPRLGRGRRSIHFSPATPISRYAKDVPRDLETIVMKAIEEHPPQRYQTAGDLAEDLSRFLDQRPIMARRATLLDHWRSWQRRNPIAAWLAAALFALANFAAVASVIGFAVTSAALKRESEQRKRAEDAIGVSWEALDRAFSRLAPDQVSGIRNPDAAGDASLSVGEPVVSPETAALLEDLLPYYGKLAAFESSDGRNRKQSASASRRVGDIHLRLGDFEKAEAAYRKAVTIASRQAAESGSEPPKVELARLYNQLGSLAERDNRAGEGKAEFQRARDLLKTRSASPEAGFEYARACYLLGRQPAPMEYSTAIPTRQAGGPPGPEGRGEPPKKGPDFRKGPPPDGPEFGGPEVFGAFPPPPGEGPPPRKGKGPHDREHRPPPKKGRKGAPPQPISSSDRNLIEEAIDVLKKNVAADSSNHASFHLLGLCYRELSNPEATESNEYQQAIDVFKNLVLSHPDGDEHRYELATTYARFDPRNMPPEYAPTAAERLRNAVKHSTLLVERHPYAADYAIQHVHTLNKLTSVLQHHGDQLGNESDVLAEAEKCISEAARRQGQLARRFPKAPVHRYWQLTFAANCAEIQNQRHEWKDAVATATDAVNSVPAALLANDKIKQAVARNHFAVAVAKQELKDADGAEHARSLGSKLSGSDDPPPPPQN